MSRESRESRESRMNNRLRRGRLRRGMLITKVRVSISKMLLRM